MESLAYIYCVMVQEIETLEEHGAKPFSLGDNRPVHTQQTLHRESAQSAVNYGSRSSDRCWEQAVYPSFYM